MTGHFPMISFLCAHRQFIGLLYSLLRLGKVVVTLWADILRRVLCMRAYARTKQTD